MARSLPAVRSELATQNFVTWQMFFFVFELWRHVRSVGVIN